MPRAMARELERRRPGTFGGLGGAVHRQACREGLQVASTEGAQHAAEVAGRGNVDDGQGGGARHSAVR